MSECEHCGRELFRMTLCSDPTECNRRAEVQDLAAEAYWEARR